ncbi:tyrosine-type recombinase/integrase [Desulfotruncus alcoholivorax]|uniref:tyrosine-type recombinase/integrase n=1 Tax=Desulfotruncus alcoholivorax TaxID=265477 RepID=UPI000484D413|nr:tyrosine-type recombinase/integrase [Desulfotruncus alcoholivorax]
MKEKYWIIELENIDQQTKVIANEFLQFMKLANKSETTIDRYRRVLEKFLTDCAKPVQELTSDDVLAWINTFYGHTKERTRDFILSILSSFFRFCLAEGYIERTLIKKRWRPRIPKSLPKYLDENELARVKLRAEKLPVRDRALVLFLLSSGCRRAEAASLNVDDLDLENRTARVKGKGGQTREVHFSEECALLLKEYLDNHHPKSEPALFVNQYGKRLSTVGIYKVTSKLGKKTGLPRKLGPHCLRHTFATNLLARGAELEFIGSELGHRDLNTTRIYARVLSEEIISWYRKIKE